MSPCSLVHSDQYVKDEMELLTGVSRREDIIAAAQWGIAKDPMMHPVVLNEGGVEVRVIKTTSFAGDYPGFNFFYRIISPSQCELLGVRPIQKYEEEL